MAGHGPFPALRHAGGNLVLYRDETHRDRETLQLDEGPEQFERLRVILADLPGLSFLIGRLVISASLGRTI